MPVNNRLRIRNRRNAALLVFAISKYEEERHAETKKEHADADSDNNADGELRIVAVLEFRRNDWREFGGWNFASESRLLKFSIIISFCENKLI